MGVNYQIIEAAGYVLPKSLLTEKELDSLVTVIHEEENPRGLDIVQQGCYGTTKVSQIFICFKKEVRMITDVKVSHPDNIAINCSEFAIIKVIDDDSPDYYTRRELILAEKKKELDGALKETLPLLYDRLKNTAFHNDWIFSYYS